MNVNIGTPYEAIMQVNKGVEIEMREIKAGMQKSKTLEQLKKKYKL